MNKSNIQSVTKLPIPMTFDLINLDNIDLEEVWKYSNTKYFYRKLLRFPRNIDNALKDRDPKAIKLYSDVKRLKKSIKHKDIMKPRVLFQFFRCNSDNNTIFIKNDKETSFTFPRQTKEPFLCLSDYIDNKEDTIAFFVVTSGREILEYAKELENEGKFNDSFIIQSIAVSTAEALAEFAHHKIRELWGITNHQDLKEDTGKRYSFGYPACPDMSDQMRIWELLDPEMHINVSLTDSYMMIPEVSVSGIVFHHPESTYFRI